MRSRHVACTALVLLLGAAEAWSGEPVPLIDPVALRYAHPTSETRAQSRVYTAKGSVVAVDEAAKAFMIKPQTGANLTFLTNERTSYRRKHEKPVFADLKAGLDLKVTYVFEGRTQVARSVVINTPAGGTK
ncbi:MAG TPA: hypothetical protein VHQ90_05950 [Thermoanaerobaculia bacterium]|nr:hypothetical protein [Thermoanaerobaculia bacterium]